MALDFLELLGKTFFSVIDLLRGSIVPGLVVFVLVLVGRKLRQVIENETGWKWVVSTLLATFVISWLVFLAAYFYPVLIASQEQGLGLLPSTIAPSAGTVLSSFGYGLLKVTMVAGIVALLVLPLQFVGAYIHSRVDKKLGKANGLVKLLAATYLTTVIASALVLFVVPQAVTGILFMLYYGFPA